MKGRRTKSRPSSAVAATDKSDTAPVVVNEEGGAAEAPAPPKRSSNRGLFWGEEPAPAAAAAQASVPEPGASAESSSSSSPPTSSPAPASAKTAANRGSERWSVVGRRMSLMLGGPKKAAVPPPPAKKTKEDIAKEKDDKKIAKLKLELEALKDRVDGNDAQPTKEEPRKRQVRRKKPSIRPSASADALMSDRSRGARHSSSNMTSPVIEEQKSEPDGATRREGARERKKSETAGDDDEPTAPSLPGRPKGRKKRGSQLVEIFAENSASGAEETPAGIAWGRRNKSVTSGDDETQAPPSERRSRERGGSLMKVEEANGETPQEAQGGGEETEAKGDAPRRVRRKRGDSVLKEAEGDSPQEAQGGATASGKETEAKGDAPKTERRKRGGSLMKEAEGDSPQEAQGGGEETEAKGGAPRRVRGPRKQREGGRGQGRQGDSVLKEEEAEGDSLQGAQGGATARGEETEAKGGPPRTLYRFGVLHPVIGSVQVGDSTIVFPEEMHMVVTSAGVRLVDAGTKSLVSGCEWQWDHINQISSTAESGDPAEYCDELTMKVRIGNTGAVSIPFECGCSAAHVVEAASRHV